MNQIEKRTFKSIFALIVGLILWTNTAQAQELKLSFTTTTISGGEYSPRHILAVWVKSSAGVYQRTLLVYANERKGYLYKWQSSSGGDRTDAITGATLSAIKAHTVTWNLKNIAGKQLQPGSYVLCMEMTSKDGQGPYREIPFNVGTSNYTLTPEDGSNFINISIEFKNSTTGINEQSIKQAEEFLKVTTKKISAQLTLVKDSKTKLEILDVNQKKLGTYTYDLPKGINQIDISNETATLPKGVYFLVAQTDHYTIGKKFIVQ
jgi:hypothetical protein